MLFTDLSSAFFYRPFKFFALRVSAMIVQQLSFSSWTRVKTSLAEE